MTTPIGTSPVTQISSLLQPSSTATEPKDQMGKDTFLKLLVAQLQYQNPMEPSDGTAFLAQTAQFSMVEKLDQVSKQNAELLAVTELLSATGLVGKQVSWVNEDGEPGSGVVTSARLSSTGPIMRVGDQDVPLAQLQEVSESVPATAPAT